MLEEILKETANEYGFTPEDLKGRDRHKTISHARQVAIYNMMMKTNCTLQECGDLLGRCPSTITQGFQKIAKEFIPHLQG